LSPPRKRPPRPPPVGAQIRKDRTKTASNHIAPPGDAQVCFSPCRINPTFFLFFFFPSEAPRPPPREKNRAQILPPPQTTKPNVEGKCRKKKKKRNWGRGFFPRSKVEKAFELNPPPLCQENLGRPTNGDLVFFAGRRVFLSRLPAEFAARGKKRTTAPTRERTLTRIKKNFFFATVKSRNFFSPANSPNEIVPRSFIFPILPRQHQLTTPGKIVPPPLLRCE